MDITYDGNIIPIQDHSGFCISDSIESDDASLVTFTIPYTKSYEIALRAPFEDVIVEFDDVDYYFRIITDGIIINETTIELKCRPKLYELLYNYMSTTYNEADYNPITAVKEILTVYSIPYNAYNIAKNEEFFDGINEIMDVVYIAEIGLINNIKIIDFLNEILKRLACILIVDYKNNEVKIHNFIETPELDEFDENAIVKEKVDKAQIKTELTDDYYNSFNIGVYPQTYAAMIYEYIYEVDFKSLGHIIYVNENDLNIVGIVATLKYNKSETISGELVLFPAATSGILTGNRAISNSYLDDITVYRGEYSQKQLYGTESAPNVSEWKDTKSNSDNSCVRHTALEGATRIGNLIVQKYWRKRVIMELPYPHYINYSAGSYIKFNGVNWVLKKQKIQKNQTAIITLEEVLC